MNLLIVVPAYQVERSLGELLSGIGEAAPDAALLVVNDGSTDGTEAVAMATSGANVISHPENRGKGAALRTGFDEAIRRGVTGVITIDGDGQHPPESIPSFVARAEETGAGIIVGARQRRHTDMPLHRRMSNKLTSWAASRMAGGKLPDSQSGYRWIATEVIRNIRLTTTHYETETELLIKAARAGFQIDSVPIPTVYAEETSHIDAWKDTVRFLRLLRRLSKED